MSVMDEVHRTFENWMILESTDALDILAGTVIGTRLDGPPLFLVLLGASGSGKSEMVEALSDVKDVYPLSDMTPQTLLSGKMMEEGSLLLKLPKDRPTIFTFKDFAPILSGRHEDRRKIMSQLREIYDGSTKKAFGGTKPKVWKGKVSLIAASTGVYDEISQDMAFFGERYLIFRPLEADRGQIACKASRSTKEAEAMKTELKRAFKLLDSLKPREIPVSTEVGAYTAMLADFTSRLRSPVYRDGYTREVAGEVQLESPAR